MRAREFLESYGDVAHRIVLLEREAALCRRFLESGREDPRWARRAKDLAAQLRKARRLLKIRRAEIEGALQRLDSPTEAAVLSLRYLSLYSYAQIAEVTFYSERHAHRLHVRGVERMEALMDRD